MALLSLHATAATLYWDTNGSTLYTGTTPTGTWDAVTTNWSTSPIGNLATTTYVPASSVVFSAGTDGTGTSTVTLNGTQKATSLNFQEGHVTIASTTVATDYLTLSGATPTLNVQNMDSIITSRVNSDTANPSITKTGVGKLSLNYGANATVSYFDFTTASTITVNGGTLELLGTASADSMRVGSIIVNSGATFRHAGANGLSNGTVITVNTGGTLTMATTDQIGNIAGTGLIADGGTINFALNGTSTFSGLLTGTGGLGVNDGTGTLILSSANTFSGTTSMNNKTGSGGIRLSNTRAMQYSTLSLNQIFGPVLGFDSTSTNTFMIGALTSTTNATAALVGSAQPISALTPLVLQSTAGTAITLQSGFNDSSSTFYGILSGSGGLTKTGLGTLTLTGQTNAANTANTSLSYRGDTTVNAAMHNSGSATVNSTTAGTLQLNFQPAVGAASTGNIINPASRLVLGGGRLLVSGNNTAGASQSFNGTLLNPGHSYVTVAQGTGSNDASVNLGSIARVAGSAVEFALPGGTQTATNGILTTMANTNGTTSTGTGTGILGAWATIGTNWATAVSNGTTNNIAAYTGYTTLSGTTQTIASDPASNLRIDDSGTLPTSLTGGSTTGNSTAVTVTSTSGLVVGQSISGPNISGGTVISALNVNGTDLTLSVSALATGSAQTFTVANKITLAGSGITDINTLQSTASTNRSIEIGAGKTLRMGAVGGIWATSTTGGLLISTGTLTAGGGTGSSGEIIFNASNTNGGIRVSSTITDNGSSAFPVTVTKVGNGELVLSVANTYTGGTYATAGRFQASNIAALGTGTVTVTSGGQMWLNTSSGAFSNNFVLAGYGYGEAAGPGAIRISNGSTMGTSASTITLAGDARIGGNSSIATIAGKLTGDYSIDFASGGGTSIFSVTNTGNDFAGNLSIDSTPGTGTSITSYGAFANAVTTVKLGSTAGTGAVSTFIPNGAGKGNVIITGSTALETLDLNGYSETINGLVSQGTSANAIVTNNAAGTTATLSLGDNNTTATFNGILKDNGTGKIALTKMGEGTQTLGGANTFSGATSINKGILKAGAANTFSASSAVVMANDPTVILDLTDFSQTIASLSGFGAVNLGTAATSPATGAVLTTGNATSTTYAGVIVGEGSLAKTGSGTFTLTGANTYLGTTAVNLGNLQVGVAGSGQTGTGNVTVASGAMLSGTGIVQGATTVNGTLLPGDTAGSGIGKLTFSDATTGSLTLAGGTTGAAPRAWLVLAGANGNENPSDGIQSAALLDGSFGNHDAIVVTGTLNLSAGSTIKVDLASGYTPSWGDVFNIFDWGAINSTTFDPTNVNDLDFSSSAALLAANGWRWDTDQFLTSGIIYVVPEPGRVMLLGVGMLFLLFSGRRRPSARF